MAQRMLESVKFVSDITYMPWTADLHTHVFTAIARVDGVEHERGWYYATCCQCSKSLEVLNGAFWCGICNEPSRYPMIRFKVHLRVHDHTGETLVTMYNQQLERLVDTTARKLLNRLGIGSHEIPVEIIALTGRVFAFNVRMPDYFNCDYDFHHYRVVSLSEIEGSTSPGFPGRRPIKIKKKTARPVFPLVSTGEEPTNNVQPCATAESTCAADDTPKIATPLLQSEAHGT